MLGGGDAYALAHQVRVNLLLEGGLVEVTGANSNTEGNGLLLGLTGDILPDSDGRVDTLAGLEQRADSAARAFRSDKDDIDIGGHLDLGEVPEHRRETVREVEGLALELGLDGGPGLRLGGVREEVHDDGSAGDGIIHLEEVGAGDPAILNGLPPRLAVLADTDDDVEAVVAEVETLAVT